MKQRSTSGRVNRSKSSALVASAANRPRALATTLAAALAAPTDVAAIRYIRPPRLITVNEGEQPLFPNGYRRHGITRFTNDYLDPNVGLPDLDAISSTWNRDLRSKVYGGGVRESSNDGSEFEQYVSNSGGAKSGAGGGTYYGYESRGRYFSFGARSFNQLAIEVDEGSGPFSVQPFVSWSQNNLQVLIDLQSYKPRKFTLRGGGDFWFAGFATEQNITPVPYDFLAGKPTYAFIGDSYWQSNAFDLVGLNIGELFIKLMGGGAQEASIWGGTGYAASGGDGIPFDSEARLALVIAAKPDVVVVAGGINDGWPTYTATGKDTAAAIRTVYQRLRQELPAAILVFVTPFSPKESNWNNPDGVARQIRLGLIAEFERTPGPCIFLDGYLGGWRTSNGQTNLFDSGPWQTGDGWQGNPTGVGFGDTWTQADATHLTPVGCIGITQVMTRSLKAALSALLGNRQYSFELPLTYRTAQQGVAVDFTDLTDEKLAWRRNMLTETEFRNGLSDAPAMSGVTLASIQGYRNAIQFTANAATIYAYKQAPVRQGITYWMSAIVQMSDNSAPIFNGGDAANVLNDFVLVVKGDATSPLQYVVQEYGGGTYRVSCLYLSTATAVGNFGVVKYSSNSNRSFKVTGYQLEQSATLTPYQPLTDVGTEFMQAFPIHSLFQDNLGNQPVWDKEQPIGLALDMRMGGARGLEVLPQPTDFSNNSVWASNVGFSSRTAKSFTTTGSGGLTYTGLTIGKWYEVVMPGISASVATGLHNATNSTNQLIVLPLTPNTMYARFQATSTSLYLRGSAAATITLTGDISIKEIQGNHAVQATVGDRPILDARVNRLLYSEQLSNAAWDKVTGTTVLDSTDAGPDGMRLATLTGGTATTSRVQQANIAVPAATTIGVSAHIKSGTSLATLLRVYNSAVSTMLAEVALTWAAGVPSISTVGGTWAVNPVLETTTVAGVYRLVGQLSSGAQTALALLYYPSSATVGDTSKAGGFQVSIGAGMPTYQRVAAATDYNAIGFLKGARFNGTNSWMQILGFSLTASDRVTASISLRRDSDANIAVAFEHGPTATATSGTFAMFAPNPAAPTIAWRVNGATSTAAISANVAAAPQTSVLTGYADLGNAVMGLRQNGTVVATDLSSRGPGNFTTQTFYIGRRAGNSLPFSGVMYRLGVRGGNYDTFLNLQERWVNEPVKVLP